jgi:phenylacetic acid degradation operon negative regulatory protein
MAPSPRSLILDLLSTLRRGAMPVRALVEAGALFGLEPNSVRVALARLLAAGRVERDERGRYRLAPATAAVAAAVAGWRRLPERLRPWEGGWVGVAGRAAQRTARRGRPDPGEQALELLGFRQLAPGLALRPDNLVGGVDAVRAALASLGLPAGRPVFAVGELDAASEACARGLWDVPALLAGYRGLRRALERSEARLPRLSRERAMVESFQVGGEAIRRLARDPLLPAPIVPAREREALVATMRRYDALGRACWAPFLAEHGVPHRHAPVDLRAFDAPTGLAPAATGGIA